MSTRGVAGFTSTACSTSRAIPSSIRCRAPSIARIDLPHGFEYELAEIGSGTSRSQGHIPLTLDGSYAQFARLHLNNHGVVRHRVAA